jgi:hypothetical protein
MLASVRAVIADRLIERFELALKVQPLGEHNDARMDGCVGLQSFPELLWIPFSQL